MAALCGLFNKCANLKGRIAARSCNIKSRYSTVTSKDKFLFKNVTVVRCNTCSISLVSETLGNWTGSVARAIEVLNTGTGYPWWLTMCMIGLIMRTVVFPVNARLLYNSFKYRWCLLNAARDKQKIYDACSKHLASSNRDTNIPLAVDAEVLSLKKQGLLCSDLFLKLNCKPWLGPVFMLCLYTPIWMLIAISVRTVLCVNQPLGFADGGIFWFSKLLVPDPYFVLPAVCAVACCFGPMISMFRQKKQYGEKVLYTKMSAKTKSLALLPKVLIVVVPSSVFIICSGLPAGLQCMWVGSAVGGYIADSVLNHPMATAVYLEVFKRSPLSQPLYLVEDHGESGKQINLRYWWSEDFIKNGLPELEGNVNNTLRKTEFVDHIMMISRGKLKIDDENKKE